MKSLGIVSALVAIIGTAALSACSSSQLPMSPGLAGGHQASSVSKVVPSSSGITFNPTSPLNLALNTTVSVAVSESGYSGGFKVVGCSAKLPVHCTPVKYGKACYENYTPDQINSISATMYAGSSTMTMSNYAAGTYFPKIVCHFKVKDSLGNTATYTASSP